MLVPKNDIFIINPINKNAFKILYYLDFKNVNNDFFIIFAGIYILILGFKR